MTPEEIKHWKHICQKNRDAGCETFRADVNVVEELCDSALRLSAIEAAVDEEVDIAADSCYSGVHRSPEGWIEKLRLIAKSRGQESADLRANLGEATTELKWLHENYSGATQAMVDNPHRWELVGEREHHRAILKIINEMGVG